MNYFLLLALLFVGCQKKEPVKPLPLVFTGDEKNPVWTNVDWIAEVISHMKPEDVTIFSDGSKITSYRFKDSRGSVWRCSKMEGLK